MDQIFRDHALFMAAGLALATFLAWAPNQTKWALLFSRAFFALSVFYPAMIVFLYLRRHTFGESYAYIVYGLIFAILLGLVAGILCIIWLVVYLTGRARGKELNETKGLFGSLWHGLPDHEEIMAKDCPTCLSEDSPPSEHPCE